MTTITLLESLKTMRLKLWDEATQSMVGWGHLKVARANGLRRFIDSFPRLVDYTAAPDPSLDEEDAKWADEILRAAGLRRDPPT